MPQDSSRRKSRIGPGLLRSIGVSSGTGTLTAGATTAATTTTTSGPGTGIGGDAPNTLFSSIRQDSETNPLRRSQRQHHSLDNAESGAEAPQEASFAHFQPISKEIADPVDRLCVAVDQLVDKMAIVADIHAGLAYFNESFGSLLYGLKMNAANIEWAEVRGQRTAKRNASL